VLGASRDGGAVLAPALKARVYRNQGWISPVLLVDGRMLGVWRHERKGSRLHVVIEPFDALPKRLTRAAEAEGERLAAFLGGKLDLTWITPSH
jgi:Winged helix DNA-binding domain